MFHSKLWLFPIYTVPKVGHFVTSVSMHKRLLAIFMICVWERYMYMYVPIVVQKPNRVLNTTWNIIQHASQALSVAWPVFCYFPYTCTCTFITQEAGFQCIYSSITHWRFCTLVLFIYTGAYMILNAQNLHTFFQCRQTPVLQPYIC